MENGINNGVPNSEATQFTPDRQPTPEQKRAGWERKRARQEIMDLMTKLRNMSVKEFDELKEDVKKNPDRHTVLETKLMQYITKERFTIDFLDRNVGKAPQDIDVTTGGEKIDTVVVKFIETKDEAGNKCNESIEEDTTSREEV
jgi:hypothetical protein